MSRLIAGAIAASIALAPSLASAADAARGKELWEARCTGCHSLDANRVGPLHKGVFGREAGTAPGFSYSPALKNAGPTWGETTLDKWLAGPSQFVPGSRMGFSVGEATDRGDIIAYLKSVSGR